MAAFDEPSSGRPYEARYADLLQNISNDHPFKVYSLHIFSSFLLASSYLFVLTLIHSFR